MFGDGSVPDDSPAADPNPTVLLGVTGSIATYKACELLRLLQKAGLRVKVVMTEHAQTFVGAATFKALSGEPVAVALFDAPAAPVHHIALAQEAVAFVIAPCTANVLNKLANGVADDLLTSTALAFAGPMIVAPAMNQDMLTHPATQQALATLRRRGVELVRPSSGYLACGSIGQGRLAQPKQICSVVLERLRHSQQLAGKRVLITAGPTREPIDPVRFISSPSSGKTGFALAHAAVQRGAEVTLISGPVTLELPVGVQTIQVQTANQMFEAATAHFANADIAIFSAAVADFAPLHPALQKIKKNTCASDQNPCLELAPDAKNPSPRQPGLESLSLEDRHQTGLSLTLVPTPDILASLAAQKTHQFVVGFAAETEDVVANAQVKLRGKGADLIVANDVSTAKLGFASDHNKVWLLSPRGVDESAIVSKEELAQIILDKINAEMC
jgi:phosphopantothenoylcysteine decarboxylase/phosphopantothenate--cysteine ligase